MSDAGNAFDDDSARVHNAAEQLTASAVSKLLLHQRRFLAHLDKWLGNRSDSEDVLQTAFEKALTAAGSLRDEEKLQAWFNRILRNAAVDRLRQNTVERNARRGWMENQQDWVVPPVEIEQRLCECVHDLLGELSEQHREALQLVEWDDLPPGVAADRIGITANAFRVRLHRARADLREKLLVICGLCAEHRCLDCWCKKNGDPPTE